MGPLKAAEITGEDLSDKPVYANFSNAEMKQNISEQNINITDSKDEAAAVFPFPLLSLILMKRSTQTNIS